jgi:hypothetical protein
VINAVAVKIRMIVTTTSNSTNEKPPCSALACRSERWLPAGY